MIVVFDFDKTLTYRDTLVGFFLQCAKNDFILIVKMPILFILVLAHKFKFITNDNFKKKSVDIILKGKSKRFIERCAIGYSKMIKFNRVYHDIFSNYEKPFVVSASFVDYVGPIFSNAYIIGSEFEYKNGCIKKLKNNCYGSTKVQMIKAFGLTYIDELYTDSLSDLPLARISKVINIVRRDKIIKCYNIDQFIDHFGK